MITFPNFPSIAGSDALVISDSNYRQYASTRSPPQVCSRSPRTPPRASRLDRL